MSKRLERNAYVKKSSVQGYGAFAEKDIFPGDVIEECYFLLLHERNSVLDHYCFNPHIEDQHEDCTSLPLGCGSIYNHSDEPNAVYDFDHANSLQIFTACRFIRRDEEIFINYGKSWFEHHGLNKIKPAVTSSYIPVKYRAKKYYRDHKRSLWIFLRGASVIAAIKLVSVLAAAVVVGN